MIHNVVASIGYRLNEYIKNSLSLSEEAVIISSLVDLKGNVNPEIENKITIFLINIEEERTSKKWTLSVLSWNESSIHHEFVSDVFCLFSKF